jgi:hypothetical protein
MTNPTNLTPEQLVALLLQELSASGSVSITDATGLKLTLREAINNIHTKVIWTPDLTDRPLDPTQKDDLLGQLLSLRAEVLQVKGIVAAMATSMNLNVNTILADVKAAIKPKS